VRRVAGADVALSLTGIAGPGGGSAAKPVGTVFIAIATASGTTVTEKHFPGDRHQIQTAAAYAGLNLVRLACS
jgi:nicotinamide-nucleotide amidase